MKIWIVNHYAIPPGQSGGTRHYDLALELMHAGHHPFIIACNFNHWSRKTHRPLKGSTWAQTEETGVPFIWIASIGYGNQVQRLVNMSLFALRLQCLARFAKQDPPDVVIGSSPHLLGAFSAWMLARRLRIPFVLEIRDIWPLSMVEVAGVSGRHPIVALFGRLEKFLYRRSEGIISLLPGTKAHIARRVFDSGPFLWLPNGINLENVAQAPREGDSKPFRILYAGSHGDANHLDTILEAAKILRGNGPEIHIGFVGQGPEKPRLIKKAQQMGLRNIDFEDPLPKRDVYQRLAKADAFIVSLKKTPLYRFGISLNKLFDYMAVGKPIIFAGDAYQNPVELAHCGVIAPPEDGQALAACVRRLISMTPEDREAMGQNGRRYVESTHNMRLLAGKLANFLRLVQKNHAEKTF